MNSRKESFMDHMIKAEEGRFREKISWFVFIPAIASLIPFIGIPFGISALLWGISDWKIGGNKAVALASLGFLLTVLFGLNIYATINNFFSSPVADNVKANYSQNSLSFLIRSIEYYKIGHGHYPNSLDDLKEKDITFKETAFIDPATTIIGVPTGRAKERQFYYKVSDDGKSYVLFSVGADKIAFTNDDIYPVILDEYKSVVGLRPKP